MSPLCLEVFLWKPSFCVFPLSQIYLKINCESDACFHRCCNEQFPSETQPTLAPEQAGSVPVPVDTIPANDQPEQSMGLDEEVL